MKKYIKMNNNNYYLSLGNLFRIIKDNVTNKNNCVQTEIFCILFNIDDINDTTVNNYCTGCRSINSAYKQFYLSMKRRFNVDKNCMKNIIDNLVQLMEGYNNEININSSTILKKVCTLLYEIAKNDKNVNSKFTIMLNKFINDNNLYECICNIIFYAVIDNKQPIYESELFNESIYNILMKTNISIKDIQEYIMLELSDGLSYKNKLKNLAINGNNFACYLVGKMEYTGEFYGYKRYDEAIKYLKIAASNKHPGANWILANMIIKGYIGNKCDNDYKNAWKYLKVAESSGSIAALNTMGICYKFGYGVKKDLNKAKTYFIEASKKDYPYAYNNLGKLAEEEKNYHSAFNYYLKSANLNESWAQNKVGLMYMKGIGTNHNAKEAFNYFHKSLSAPINERCEYASINLANYFYLNGNSELLIPQNIEYANKLLNKRS